MADIYSEVETIRASEELLTSDSGKVANFSYTQDAYDDDDYAGVESYDYSQAQNIPLATASILEANQTILDKGFRSQASSISRQVMNHFFGRTSYNLNKIHDYFKTFLSLFQRHLAQDNGMYSSTATYQLNDITNILYTNSAGKSWIRTFICINEVGVTGVQPLSTGAETSWKEVGLPENDICPIGFIYTQYPTEASPWELWAFTEESQWEDISSHYAGLFPRIEGGNAEEFESLQECAVSGTTVLMSSDEHTVTTSSLLIDPNTWEQRAVTAVSGTTVTIESAFSDSASITNVLVVQNEGLPNITGNVTALLTNISNTTTSGAVNVGLFAGGSGSLFPGDNMTTKIGYNSSTIIYGTNTTVKSSTFIKLNASNSSAIYGGSSHNTPINLTIRVWKRIS